MNVYREVGVSVERRQLAQTVASQAAYLLGLPPVTVRFFRRGDSKLTVGDTALNLLGGDAGPVRERWLLA